MTVTWKYAAETASGDVVSGVLIAVDESEVAKSLRSKRLTPLTIDVAKPTLFSRISFRNANTLSLPELATTTRRISDLLTAGLPLEKALELAKQQSGTEKQRAFFAHLQKEVQSGRALSIGLANSDIKAPPFVSALTRTGESIGALDAQFAVLADHYERALKTRQEVTAQLVYPAALMVLILLTMVFLSFFVLPQFETVFANADAIPPPETRMALAAGGFIRSNLAFAPLVILLILAAWRFAAARYNSQLEKAHLATPIIGRLRRDHEMGRYYRSLATMLNGGMALADAMPLATETVQLQAIRSDLARVENDVRGGDRLSAAITRNVRAQREATSFLEVGDETGTLAAMTTQAANFAEARVKAALKKFTALLSPVLTAIMGLVTAGVIAAVMSGVLSLNDAVY